MECTRLTDISKAFTKLNSLLEHKSPSTCNQVPFHTFEPEPGSKSRSLTTPHLCPKSQPNRRAAYPSLSRYVQMSITVHPRNKVMRSSYFRRPLSTLGQNVTLRHWFPDVLIIPTSVCAVINIISKSSDFGWYLNVPSLRIGTGGIIKNRLRNNKSNNSLNENFWKQEYRRLRHWYLLPIVYNHCFVGSCGPQPGSIYRIYTSQFTG